MVYIKKSRSQRVLKLCGILLLIIICAVGSFLLLKSFRADKVNITNNTAVNTNEMQTKGVGIIRAAAEVEPGEIADATKFELISVPENLVPQDAVGSIEELRDKRIKNKLYIKQFVLKSDLIPSSAWYGDEDRLIEHTFLPGTIPSSATSGSIIDIKLFRQGAMDAVVISKVVIVNKQENTLSLYLNSREQEYLKEAATEGLLFITQYLDASQTPSDLTYTPSYD